MQTKYFYHSPRGFRNEITIYAVPAEQADAWAAWFEDATERTDYADTALFPITRQQARRMLSDDGVCLLIREEDYDYEDCTSKRLTRASVESARLASIEHRTECEKSRAFEIAAAEQYEAEAR